MSRIYWNFTLREFRRSRHCLKDRQEQERAYPKHEQIVQKRLLEPEDRVLRRVENGEKRGLEKKLAAQYRRGKHPQNNAMPALGMRRGGDLSRCSDLGNAMNDASGHRSAAKFQAVAYPIVLGVVIGVSILRGDITAASNLQEAGRSAMASRIQLLVPTLLGALIYLCPSLQMCCQTYRCFFCWRWG